MEIGLGISEEDKNLLTNSVEIFYNFAATIRFDETLKRATLLNTRGTRELLELAKQCKKLEVVDRNHFCKFFSDINFMIFSCLFTCLRHIVI